MQLVNATWVLVSLNQQGNRANTINGVFYFQCKVLSWSYNEKKEVLSLSNKSALCGFPFNAAVFLPDIIESDFSYPLRTWHKNQIIEKKRQIIFNILCICSHLLEKHFVQICLCRRFYLKTDRMVYTSFLQGTHCIVIISWSPNSSNIRLIIQMCPFHH